MGGEGWSLVWVVKGGAWYGWLDEGEGGRGSVRVR